MESNKRIDANILQFRLDATRDAQKMSRLAFLVLIILSLAIILATWNAYFSWYTGFALKEDAPKNDVTKIVNAETIEQWVESGNITLPFLGIKMGVSDCSVFGSIGLSIIMAWLYLSIRREYDVIHSLLKNTRNPAKWDTESKRWIFYGIASYMLFIDIKEITKPVENKIEKRNKLRSRSQLAFKALLFFPIFSISFLIFADLLTIFVLPANYRFPHTPLYEHLRWNDTLKLIGMEGLAFILLIFIIWIYIKILLYVENTAKDLNTYANEYRNEFKNKSECHGNLCEG